MSRATGVAERIAALGFGEAAAPIELEDSDEMVAVLRAERILGVAVSGVQGGQIIGSADALGAIGVAHDEVMRQSMRIEIEALNVASVLSDAGVEHRFLKGTALAHVLYDDPAERSFRAVDVLVHGSDIDRAVAELTLLGATRARPQLRDGYDARFGKSVTLRRDGVEIDLHRVLSPGPFGVWSNPRELFLLRRSFHVAGHELSTLDSTDHLVHACYHVALGQVTPVLANLRDIVLLATLTSDPVDFDRFNETVDRWRGGAVIKRAVRLVDGRLDIELPDALASYRNKPVPREELEMITPYLSDDPGGRFAALAPSTLKALPMSDRAGFALAVGLPDGTNPRDRARDLLKRAKR